MRMGPACVIAGPWAVFAYLAEIAQVATRQPDFVLREDEVGYFRDTLFRWAVFAYLPILLASAKLVKLSSGANFSHQERSASSRRAAAGAQR